MPTCGRKKRMYVNMFKFKTKRVLQIISSISKTTKSQMIFIITKKEKPLYTKEVLQAFGNDINGISLNIKYN